MCIRVSPTGLDAQRSMAAEKEAIEAFAQANGIEIVGEYIDEDDGRLASPALKRLVADARFPECNFRTVLVYEMSRSTPGGYAPPFSYKCPSYHTRLPLRPCISYSRPSSADLSIKPLYCLSRAVVRLVAHGGPKSEFSSPGTGCPAGTAGSPSLVFVRLLGLLHRLFQANASAGRSISCWRMPARGLSPGSGKV